MALLMRDQENIEKGIKETVSVMRKYHIPDAEIEIQEEYNLTREEAEEYL